MKLKISFLIVLSLLLLNDPVHAQISDDAVILTLRNQNSINLDSAIAARINSALNSIRNKVDTLHEVHAFPAYSTDCLLIKTRAAWSKNWYDGNLLTGEKDIDSLNQLYKLVKVDVPYYSSLSWFKLYFSQPMNIPLLAELYKTQPDIIAAAPNFRSGDGDDIEFIDRDSICHFAFSKGQGDCASDCIEHEYWYVTTNPGNNFSEVNLEEYVPAHSTDLIIPRWNIPDGYAMTMFRNVNAIFDSINSSPNWWVRRHAVEGLGNFFKSDYPWTREDINEHWYNLKFSLDSLKSDAVAVIITASYDPDINVRTSAEKILQTVGDLEADISENTNYDLSQNNVNQDLQGSKNKTNIKLFRNAKLNTD